MTLHVVRADRVAPQRWKNGGGLTRELLAWPARVAAGDAWSLRISVADIGADGPFSAFPGVERWFAVLEGAGVRLGLPGGERSVEAGEAPLRFGGEAAPHCALIDGPTRDLNLMIRRDAGRGTMQRAQPGAAFAPHARFRALFAAVACTLMIDDADALALPAFALAWADKRSSDAWRIALADGRPLRAWWIAFEPGPA